MAAYLASTLAVEVEYVPVTEYAASVAHSGQACDYCNETNHQL
jgi:hypothetical protein